MSEQPLEDEAQRAWELEMEKAMADRGRTRSHSILATHTSEEAAATGEESGVEEHPPMDRRRSRSFTSHHQHESTDEKEEEDSEQLVKRAASLSRIYLAGSAPVDVRNLQNNGKKVEVVVPTGALSTQALDALSEGLQSFSVGNETVNGSTSAVTTLPAARASFKEDEAALEEEKMAEEEDDKLKHQRLSTARKSLAAKASFFKGKMFKTSKTTAKDSNSGRESVRSSLASSTKEGTAALATETADASTILPPPAPKGPIKRHKLKLLLLGDSGVGKTSLMRVFSGDEFSESMLATAGVDFKLRNIAVGDDEIALQIWDTAGQERFHRITATYYKGANGIVLVYDVNDKKSYDNVGYWMNNIRQYASPNMPAMLLVGNKIDLSTRVVSTEEGAATAKQYDVRFIETSAKTSENTNGALETIARDAFVMSLNGDVTQKMLMEKEKSLLGRRSKENCTVS